MRTAPFLLIFLAGCWPYLPQPFEEYIDGDSDSDDVDTTDPDTDPDTEGTDPDTDPDTIGDCTDDSNEEDDDLQSGTPIQDGSRVSGTICPGDNDVMRLTIPDGCEASVTLGFNHALGDLDLYLFDGNDEVAVSDSQTSDESLTFVGDGGLYGVLVTGYQGASNDYLLVASIECDPDVDTDTDTDSDTEADTDPDTDPPGCIDDIVDRSSSDDDVQADATVLTSFPASLDRQICQGDDDWFRIDSTDGCTVDITAQHTYVQTPVNDLEMRVVDQFGTTVFSGTTSTDDEFANDLTVDGPLFARVYGYQTTESPYTFVVTEDCSAIEPVCVDDPLEDNDTIEGAYTTNSGTGSVSPTVCPDDTSDFFRIPVDDGNGENCELEVTLTHDWEAGMDLGVIVYQSIFDSGATYTVGTDGSAFFREDADNDFVYIEVEDRAGNVGVDYQLDYEIMCDDVVDPVCGDSFEGDSSNNLRDGATVLGSLPIDLDGGICSLGDEDWYQIETDPGCELTIDLLFTDTASDNSQDIDLRLWESSTGLSVATSGSGTSNERIVYTAQESTLWVDIDGYQSGQGDYNLIITEDCPVVEPCEDDDFEPNDDQYSIIAVPFDSGGRICDQTDIDQFQIDVGQPDETCYVSVSTTSGEDDLVLELRNPQDELVGRVSGSNALAVNSGEESFGVFSITVSADTVLDEINYGLTIDATCGQPGECLPDTFEDGDGNDTVDNGVYLGAGPNPVYESASLCEDDTDWYNFDFTNGCKLGVMVGYPYGSEDIDINLSVDGSPRGSLTTGEAGQILVYSPRSSGIVDLEVQSDLVHTNYTITSGLFDCDTYPCATDNNEPNNDYAARTAATGAEQYGTACDDDVDYWKTEFSQVCPTVVTVRAPEALDLDWIDANGNSLASVDSSNPLRMMGLSASWTVSGGRGTDYLQTVSHDCDTVPTCPEDDVFAPNDSADRSVPVTWNITADLAACESDDWFRLPPVPPGCAGIVEVQPLGSGIVRGQIVTAAGIPVGGFTTIGSGSSDFIADAEEQYYAQVLSQNQPGEGYDIDFLLDCN